MATKLIPITTPEPDLGLTGKGVEPARIKELDKLIKAYFNEEELAEAAAEKLSEAKAKVMDAMHEHSEQLENPNTGDLSYKFDHRTVMVVAGNEKLKVQTEGKKK